MNINRIDKEIAFFREFLTDERNEKIEEVLNNRTTNISVVLEDIYHSHNASAVIRTCDCFGIQNLHVIENLKKNRINKCVTQGAAKWISINKYKGKVDNTEDCFLELKKQGYQIVGTALNHSGTIDIQDLPVGDNKIALCFGCEELGMSEKALEMSDYIVKIPMYGFTQSFNISVSVALSLQILTEKLHRSCANWRLSEDEKKRLKHKWIKGSVKNADLLLTRLEGYALDD